MNVGIFLNFAGNAAEALDFYAGVFGTEPQNKMTYGDMPPSEELPVLEEEKGLLMYGMIMVGSTSIAMSDMPERYGPLNKGNNMTIYVAFNDMDKVNEIFNKISEGGTVTMAQEPTFFSKSYGECIDRYGVQWAILLEDESWS